MLSLLLFSICMKLLHEEFNLSIWGAESSIIINYDTQLHTTMVKILSLYLEDIAGWMGRNRLKWGPNKTELLFIHHNSLSVLLWRTSAVPEMASPWLKILLHEQAEVQKAFSQHSWCTGCGSIGELFVTIIYVPITIQLDYYKVFYMRLEKAIWKPYLVWNAVAYLPSGTRCPYIIAVVWFLHCFSGILKYLF